MQALLEVRHLTISFHTYRGLLEAIHDVSLTVNPGETVGIVGESGCGKSVTSQAAMKLLPAEATEYTSGQILWDGRDVLPLSEQKIHPPTPLVPSRLGQVNPPSMDSLYTLQPKRSR